MSECNTYQDSINLSISTREMGSPSRHTRERTESFRFSLIWRRPISAMGTDSPVRLLKGEEEGERGKKEGFEYLGEDFSSVFHDN